MAYTTAQIQANIAVLEAGIAQSFAVLRKADGSTAEYRTVADIRNAIAYWQALLNDASDAPTVTTPKVRSYLFHGGKGFSSF